MKKYTNIPLVLIILDGWGIAAETPGNAVCKAKTPNMDKYITTYPALTLAASGKYVGLSEDDDGNSEIGHLNIGLGRLIQPPLTRINNSIKDNSFFNNQAFLQTIEHIKKNRSNLHLIGLLGAGGVHSHLDHLFALLDLAKKLKVKQIYIHAIMDGWDTPPNSGLGFIKSLQEKIKADKIPAQIATISGRFYAMDRLGNWSRTEKYFKALIQGEAAESYKDPISAIKANYAQGIFDDKIKPTVITSRNKPLTLIKNKDGVIFFNFRADRAKQLTSTFVLPDFAKFDRQAYYQDLFFCTMAQYDKDLPVDAVAFPNIEYDNSLAEVLSHNNLRQLHVTETEKYAHLTYYFNGKRKEPFENEDWQMIPSLKIDNYANKPAMSAAKITDYVLKAVSENKYDFIVINYPNTDLVSHTGDLQATIKACQIVDKQLSKIVPLVLSKAGMVLITADHGNAEELQDIQTGETDTTHSNNPVPFILISKDFEGKNIGLPDTYGADLSLLTPKGTLADIAPTILDLLNLDKPEDMTGKSLI